MSRGLSLGFLPSIVMEDQKLIEKHAKAAGLGDIDVQWHAFIGGSTMNEQLIAGQVDFAAGGPPPFMVLWDRTGKLPQAVKGVAAICSSPMYLLTRNPDIKTVKDFTSKDRIAVPGLKISDQAVVLKMAAEKAFGDQAHLDPMTVMLSLPDAYAMLLSGGEINSAFSGPPFQYLDSELKKSGVHRILKSDDVLGGPATFLMMWTTTKFYQENPKTYKAVYDALSDAIDLVNSDKEKAAEIFLRVTKEHIEREKIVKILENPDMRYTLAPQNIMTYAEFLHRTGLIKASPKDWKDFFFPGPVYDLGGN
jgi:NitT/TauT family transport system substrate-binding protein